MNPTILDERLLAKLFGNVTPIEEKAIYDKSFSPLQEQNIKTIPQESDTLCPCGIGDFIGVICSSYCCGEMDRYEPYPQVWFTVEEVTEKCIGRGYQMNIKQSRKYLLQLLNCRANLIEERDNITIGRKEYRRVRIEYKSAKKYFDIEAPMFKCEWPPNQEWRKCYGRKVL